jgi:hypothetical protein
MSSTSLREELQQQIRAPWEPQLIYLAVTQILRKIRGEANRFHPALAG